MSNLESTLAIDFGTTNSVVFVYKSEKPEAVPAGNYNTDKNQHTLTASPGELIPFFFAHFESQYFNIYDEF